MSEPSSRPSWRADDLSRGEIVVTEVRLAPPATRHVAAGGWRRAVVGLFVGGLAAVLVSRFVAADAGHDRQARAAR